MKNAYTHVRAAVASVPWLVYPPVMDVITDVLSRRVQGERFSESEIDSRIAAASSERRMGPRTGAQHLAGDPKVIPVYGVIAQRATMLDDTSSSGTSVNAVTQAFRRALADPDVSGVLLDFDSPGGSAAGVPELAAEIRNSRGIKPIVAVSNAFCASAALYLAAQADEFYVSPSSLTGSVGVVMAHVDWSAAEEKAGVKTTLVYAGDHKVEGYDTVPMSDEARDYRQSLVDDLYVMFVDDMAAGRGVSAAKVMADFGQGRVLTAANAVRVGMADAIGTFDDAMARLRSGKVQTRGATAESGYVEPLMAAADRDEAPADVGDPTEPNERSVAAAAARALARAKAS